MDSLNLDKAINLLVKSTFRPRSRDGDYQIKVICLRICDKLMEEKNKRYFRAAVHINEYVSYFSHCSTAWMLPEHYWKKLENVSSREFL